MKVALKSSVTDIEFSHLVAGEFCHNMWINDKGK